MSIKYPPDLADRVAKLLSEILTDKYGDEYNCKITLRRKQGGDKKAVERCG